jgi:hypothetical protein
LTEVALARLGVPRLSTAARPYKSYRGIMKMLGDTRVTLLKMDIDTVGRTPLPVYAAPSYIRG